MKRPFVANALPVPLFASLLRSVSPLPHFLLLHILTPLFLSFLMGCSEDESPCRYEDIKPGMVVDDVRFLMGPPISVVESDISDRWHYQCDGGQRRKGGKDILIEVAPSEKILSVTVFHHGGHIEKVF